MCGIDAAARLRRRLRPDADRASSTRQPPDTLDRLRLKGWTTSREAIPGRLADEEF